MSDFVAVDQLSVRYHGHEQWILGRISLTQLSGQVTAVVGPSGCGKSTLIRTVAGLIPHSIPSDYQGTVVVDGVEIADAEVVDIATRVAYVGQNPDAAIVTRTVHDEVCFPLQNLCLTPAEIETRALDALRTVGLEHRLWEDPWKLSGGLRQRLALAVALAMEPELLILDEPTSTIDTLGRDAFYSIIPPLVARGMGVLVIDHDLDPLLPIVDQVVALNREGEIIACGAAREVFFSHARELEAEGIWLPRAVRSSVALWQNQDLPSSETVACDRALTCNEAGITLPTLDDFCDPNTVTYYCKYEGAWQRLNSLDTPSGEASADLKDFRIPGRAPAISVRLGGGELVAVVGPNGSGKSSLLSGLAGILEFEATRAYIHGRKLNKRSRDVGYVFQNPEHQFVETSVEREIGVGGTAPEIVEQLLGQFGLLAHRTKHPLTLSGGQSRRLSVATMVSENKSMVVLDEPTYGQDWDNTRELMRFITQLRDSGKTVIMATHDLELAQTYASHIIALPFSHTADSKRAERPTGNLSWLGQFNPFALFLGVIAPIVALFFIESTSLNLAAMTIASLAILTSRAGVKRILGSVAAIWIIAAVMMWVVSNAVNPNMYEGVREIGESSTAGTFVGALLGLVLVAGIATNPEAIIRSMTATLHLPYRIGAAGTASLAFVSRFAIDFSLLRTARRLRGVGDSWGIAAPVNRWVTSIVPLIITAVQHGERVALSMDSRGFGAYARRTELEYDPWRMRDTIAVILLWSAAVLAWWMH